MKLSRKINQNIAASFIVAMVLLMVVLLPLQTHKETVLHKKITSLMQKFVTRDMGPLANAIFENRTLAINLRMDEIIRIEGISSATVFDARFRVLSDTDHDVSPGNLMPFFQTAQKDGQTSWTSRNNIWYLQSIHAFDDIIGYLLVEYSVADMKRSENLGLITVTALISLLMLILLWVSHLVIQKIIIRPIANLLDNMAQIQSGRYGGQIKTVSRDELGDLAWGFNAMSREIAQSYRKIETQNKELTATKNLLDNIIDSMPAMLVTVDRQLRVLDWNRAAMKRAAVPADQAAGSRLSRFLPMLEAPSESLLAAIDKKEAQKLSRVESFLGNNNYVLDIMVYPIETDASDIAVIIVDDITDMMRMDAVMIQTEKMMSVGGLAAGMAHEINNPLAGMIQNAQVIENRLLADLPANRKAAEETGIRLDRLRAYVEHRKIPQMLEAMNHSGIRASKIVRNMLSFSRKAGQGYSMENLADLIDATLDLAKNDYGLKKKFDFQSLQIIREYEPNAAEAECDGNKIQQVLFNILKNGAEAMAQEREDTAEAGRAGPPKTPCFTIRLYTRSDMACIDIRDNGPGMDAATRKRVFEPFFTTKEVGVGTGLGLSVSYFIITDEHKGRLSVVSAPGAGTTFSICLPIRHTPGVITP